MTIIVRREIASIIGFIAIVGCGRGSDAAATRLPVALGVQPSNIVMRAGETVQLVVQANDSSGRPVGGAPILFAVDSTGLVRVTRQGLVSTVGRSGRDSLIVISGSVRQLVPVLVAAGVPTVIAAVDTASQVGLAGVALPGTVSVIVRDAFGNVVPRATVQFLPQSGGAATPATTVTDASGQARTLWTLGPLAGPQSLRVQADSAQLTIDGSALPGPMVRVVDLDPAAARARAGDPLSVRLRAVDSFGNGVERAVFAYRVEAGGGSVTPARVESDASGMASTVWRSGTKAGVNVLRVDVSQQQDTTLLISRTSVGGAPATLAIVSGDRPRVASGRSVQRPPVWRVSDRYGNPVTSVRVRFLVVGAQARVEPSEVVTDERGLASPRAWTLGDAGVQELIAVADGVRDSVRVRATAVRR